MFQIVYGDILSSGADAIIHFEASTGPDGVPQAAFFVEHLREAADDFAVLSDPAERDVRGVRLSPVRSVRWNGIVADFLHDEVVEERLDAFAARLEHLVQTLADVAVRSVAVMLPAEDYCGLEPANVRGMLRAALCRRRGISLFVYEPESSRSPGGGSAPSITQARREAEEQRMRHLLARDIRAAYAERREMQLLQSERVVRVGRQTVGTIFPNPEAWVPYATDLFAFREARTGLWEHAASIEEAEASLIALAKDVRGRPATPDLERLLAHLGDPPRNLDEFVRFLPRDRDMSRSLDRRLPIEERAQIVKAGAFLRELGDDARGRVWRQLADLKDFARTKRKSQHARLRRRLLRQG